MLKRLQTIKVPGLNAGKFRIQLNILDLNRKKLVNFEEFKQELQLLTLTVEKCINN